MINFGNYRGCTSGLVGLGLALAASGCGNHLVRPGPVEQPVAPGQGASAVSVIIQSHRGAGDLAPENTLATFELGWRMGTVPEADLRTARDGVLVAFHDDTFARLVKDAPAGLRDRRVEELTWAELSRLEVGAYKGLEFAGQQIPRMADVFAAMRGRPERRLYLDIKNVSLEQLAGLVREHDVEPQVILSSADYAMIRKWQELAPNSQTLLWIRGSQEQIERRLREVRAAGWASISQLQLHVRVGDLSGADPFTPSSTFIEDVAGELRSRGILFQVLPISPKAATAKPADVYQRLMQLGVQSFATDDPPVCLAAVREYLAAHPRMERVGQQ